MSTDIRTIPEYAYRDLPADGTHIRVLKLEPGEREDFIHCHLEPTTLQEAHGKYECISYVWGSSSEIRRILVDGHWIYVTLNLFHALQHFRKRDEVRTLWADAICIQQMNPREKGSQVQLMGRIYENSLRTLVWLGVDHENIGKSTTEFLKHVSNVSRELNEKYDGARHIPNLSRADNPVPQDPDKWAMYKKFLEYKWFTRCWVMQEVGIAPEVSIHWGTGEVPLSDIINVNELARHAPHLFEVLPISWNMHDVFLGVFMTYGNPNTWRDRVVQWYIEENFRIVPNNSCLDVLIQSSRRDVTDQRDHIYALLAHPLLQVNGESIVRADYEKHVDLVYRDVAKKLIEHVDATLALGVAGGMGKRKPRNLSDGKPTWVARWDLCLQTSNIGRPNQWYHAGGKNVKPTLDIKGEMLTVSGILLDTVVWTSDQIPATHCSIDDVIHDPERQVAMEWVWDAIPSEPCRYTGKFGSRDAFTLTMCCGKYKVTGEAEEDIKRHHRQSRAFTNYIRSFFAGGSGDDRLKLDARIYEEDHGVTAKDRRFLVTEGGFYGLGPQLMEEKDVVAVMPGLNVPFVLRPTGSGEYKLVGASYVHGVMRGEVFDENNPLKIDVGKPEDIVIV